jgi:hypothetical protein
MSTLSAADRVIEGLQKIVDRLSEGNCCPSLLLKQFDYSLLTRADINLRKTAMFAIFVILRASLNRAADKRVVGLQINAPLVVEDDIVYLVTNGADKDLSSLHERIVEMNQKNPTFFSRQVFAYHMDGSRDGLLLGIEHSRMKKKIILRDCLFFIPDPKQCQAFLLGNPQGINNLAIMYKAIEGGEVDVPSCSTSDSEEDQKDDTDSESCIFEKEVTDSSIINDLSPECRGSSSNNQSSRQCRTTKSIHKISIFANLRNTEQISQLKQVQTPELRSGSITTKKFVLKTSPLFKRYLSTEKSRPEVTERPPLADLSRRGKGPGMNSLSRQASPITRSSEGRQSSFMVRRPDSLKRVPLQCPSDKIITKSEPRSRGFFAVRLKPK